jgi:Mg-chelatase subunit ChlD
MKQDYTHVTVILDRSGSMDSIRDDIIGGFNSFLREQKAEPGQATMTLVQFDTEDPYEVIHRFKPIEAVPELDRATYVPRGCTPLLDAFGRGINDIEKSLGELAEEDRPSKVMVVALTDGQENASREFTKDQIEKMVKVKTAESDWQFVFLTTDLAAFGDARALGIHAGSSLLFVKSAEGSVKAWKSLSRGMSDYRSGRKRQIGFGPGDRKHPDDPEKQKS